MGNPLPPFVSRDVEKRISTSLDTNGEGEAVCTGILRGIARHARPKGPMEVLDAAEVSLEGGVAGDFRGAVRPGRSNRRQVTLMEAGDWAAATALIGRAIDWQERRVNLLVDGIDLPQRAGARIRIGADVVLEVTGECDPCRRMDELAEGLCAALTPDWRAGALSRVLAGGTIRVGDIIEVEDEA